VITRSFVQARDETRAEKKAERSWFPTVQGREEDEGRRAGGAGPRDRAVEKTVSETVRRAFPVRNPPRPGREQARTGMR